MGAPLNVGDSFVLWRYNYKKGAYVDQFGVSHFAYLVDKVVIATIVEIRDDVPGVYDKTPKWRGYKAIDSEGTEYTCNWDEFNEGSMQSTSFWVHHPNSGKRVYYHKATEHGGPYILDNYMSAPVTIEDVLELGSLGYELETKVVM